jgi:hypothetical protein
MVDAHLSYFFQTLGGALVACVVCWVCLPKAGLAGPEQRLLFAKLLGVFMALHYLALGFVLGGANIVVTAFATYCVGRWVLLPKRSAK